MAFVKSVPEAEESVAAVLRRYPQHAVLITDLADFVMRSGDCAFTSESRKTKQSPAVRMSASAGPAIRSITGN